MRWNNKLLSILDRISIVFPSSRITSEFIRIELVGISILNMGSVPNSGGKVYPPGIHVPCLTWFVNDSNQEVDWELQKQHLEFLISSGLDGSKSFTNSLVLPHMTDLCLVVIAGTNGEAVTLTTEEKSKLLRLTREVAVNVGRPSISITMGCVGQCTRDVIAETQQAKEAGADYALVLVPSYFHFAMNQEAIIAFFEEVSIQSYLQFTCWRTDHGDSSPTPALSPL